MNIRSTENDTSFILIVAFVLSPFTMLRFSFFGLSELILLCCFIFSFKISIRADLWQQCIFTHVWVLYLFISSLGLSYNTLVLGSATGTIAGATFDFASYIFILLTCYLMEMKFLERKLCPLKMLKLFYTYLTALFLILYVLSLFSASIFGLPLRYEGSFAPLVVNIHQSAMILVTLPFIGLFLFMQKSNIKQRSILFLSILLLYIIALDTSATKALMGLYLGTAVFAIFSFKNVISRRMLPVVLLCMIAGLIVAIVQFDLITLASAFFNENDGGGARSIIYFKGVMIGLTSPMIGLGPGGHIFNDNIFYDAHQTLLTVFLQAGLCGLILYLLLMFKIIRSYSYSSALIACLCAISIYSLGGDILRRLPIWLILLLIYYTSQKIKNNIN